MNYIFLDRDGVINEPVLINNNPHPPKSSEELIITQSSKEAIKLLQKNSYEIIVVTNQPDVTRGKTTKDAVYAINKKISEICNINHFRICFHDDSDKCNCRKPKPGLLIDASKEFKFNLEKTFMIGDRNKDIIAGQRAGCKTIFIDRRYKEEKPYKCDKIVDNLLQAVLYIIGSQGVTT
tara:strand:+ start:477 stop:1013 length:537 start_codon:yes stop_codon:yes gene_type:complete